MLFTTVSLPAIQIGVALNAPIVMSGAVDPVSFTVSAGALPEGLALTKDASGALFVTGMPLMVGPFDFTVTATDSTPTTPAMATQRFTGAILAATAGVNVRIDQLIGCIAADINGIVTGVDSDLTAINNKITIINNELATISGGVVGTPLFVDEDFCALYAAARTAVLI